MEQIQYFPAVHAPQNPFFSILIPSWNNLPYLQLCISSIRKNSAVDFELIVHVNESSDGTKDWIEAEKDIAFSFSEQNVGVCYAMNAMRKLSNATYLLYLNDDMYVLPEWDTLLRQEIMNCDTNYFFFSSTMLEPRPQSSCSIEADFGRSISVFDEAGLLAKYSKIPFHDWHGATWPPNVVHRELWDKVHGYSVEFSPGMYSDPDFSMKLWNAGVRLFKGIGQSRVYHFGSMSLKRVKKNKGYFQFIKKWGMTSSTLSIYFLRRGEKFDGPLKEVQLPLFIQIKNFYYRLSLKWRH